MPERLAILGQQRPTTANTAAAAAYTVPTGAQAVVSSVVVANTSTAAATFRLFVSAGGVNTYAQATALFWDVAVPAGSSQVVTLGATLAAGSTIGFSSSAASALTCTIFGQEVS